MAKLQTEVYLLGVGKVKTLIEILYKEMDSLSDELKAALNDCLDSEEFEFTDKEFAARFGTDWDVKVEVNGELSKRGIQSVNPHLKRLTVFTNYYNENERPKINEDGKSFITCYVYPEKLLVTDSVGNPLLGW